MKHSRSNKATNKAKGTPNMPLSTFIHLEPEKQIDVLKSLVEALSNEEIMNGIKSAKTPDEVYDLLIYED